MLRWHIATSMAMYLCIVTCTQYTMTFKDWSYMYMYNAYMYDTWERHEGYTHPHLTVERSISGNERGTRSRLLAYAYACILYYSAHAYS